MNNNTQKPQCGTDCGQKFEKELEKMSPFEIKNTLIDYAQRHSKTADATFLNAGRGNPNWICTTPRQAFFLLGQFGIIDCHKHSLYDSADIAPIPQREGIATRLMSWLGDCQTASFIKRALAEAVKMGLSGDDVVYEWVSGIIGDQYPSPDRILPATEAIVSHYICREMCNDDTSMGKIDLFATEGGTAAMCYLFNTLKANKLLNHGDHIAIMTPIFTPYIEIPKLAEFGFHVTEIKASSTDRDGYHTWQYPDSELDKLKDPSIKLLCVVNPSNPPSYALDDHTHRRIAEIVSHDNPDLMIITDDVYGTFVDGFSSLFKRLPYNTACVYSFSKYFGCTGWRIAVIATAEHNIFDAMIAKLSENECHSLHRRYASIALQPDRLKFIDRLVADSRLVALNHTAGLSTPQQVQMSLFALYALLDTDNNYKKQMQSLIASRLTTLWNNTGFQLKPDKLRAGYYTEIDILLWADKLHGSDFAKWLTEHYETIDFVIRLAKETGIVLLNGGGFDGPEWSVRASLANLDEADYDKIGRHIGAMLEEYASQWYPEN
ncbi:MAG: bifunctional aspartate transaminase/aspartate 4-decarboxylase [Muribaculaceae bacterium]|nr:bifunctional aspartate transaminase/aspartate 4-decarboxylase [Muribaculaceae bacterium]